MCSRFKNYHGMEINSKIRRLYIDYFISICLLLHMFFTYNTRARAHIHTHIHVFPRFSDLTGEEA